MDYLTGTFARGSLKVVHQAVQDDGGGERARAEPRVAELFVSNGSCGK
jgi:hypothetical protein